ncbi:hypothetical protein [Xanthocytophaga agilis]|uniref:Uncharacterized protein n=1 Tax=Xanthocytophaga agilis TaxID=3048010 RepID=A0AAE3R9A3_9BACT|nr:hypothetical protein [Xanthocytophaga agilis]MDJ1506246.1 hypothetical protein [Xanthocytophaga agilis]
MAKGEKQVFALWDNSMVEKHETVKNKHLRAMCSSKTKRVTRIRPSFYQKCCDKTIQHIRADSWTAMERDLTDHLNEYTLSSSISILDQSGQTCHSTHHKLLKP